jgi:hypothetical protein
VERGGRADSRRGGSRNCKQHEKPFVITATTYALAVLSRKGQRRGEREGDNNKRVPPRLKLFDRQRGWEMIGRGAGREQGDGTSRWLQATGKVPGGTEAGARVAEHEKGKR